MRVLLLYPIFPPSFWSFERTIELTGKKAMLPAGVIRDPDLDTETVFVNRTKDQIKNAPEFDEKRYRDQDYQSKLGSYYDRGGAGYTERR